MLIQEQLSKNRIIVDLDNHGQVRFCGSFDGVFTKLQSREAAAGKQHNQLHFVASPSCRTRCACSQQRNAEPCCSHGCAGQRKRYQHNA